MKKDSLSDNNSTIKQKTVAMESNQYPQNPGMNPQNTPPAGNFSQPQQPYQQQQMPYQQPQMPYQQPQMPYQQPQMPYPQQQANPIQPQQQPQALDFSSEIRKMIVSAGTLELTDKQNEILYAPVKDHDVFIKPDGLIYLSWMKYSERLNKAFGGTSWAMIPEGMPKGLLQKSLIVWGFHLVIKGVYCGFAIGEQAYFDNGRMSYGEACEGAKSNALMRLCKNIGIGLELWDKNFIDRWVKTYSESYKDNEGKTKWKLKAGVQEYFLKLQAQEKSGVPQNTTSASENKPAQAQAMSQVPQNNTPQAPVSNTAPPAPRTAEKPVAEATETKKRGRKVKPVEPADDVPMEKIPDSELGSQEAGSVILNEKTQPYYDTITACASPSEIRPVFERAKAAQAQGEISENELEFLRQVANDHFVKLNAKK